MTRIPLLRSLTLLAACAPGVDVHASQGAPVDVLESIACMSSEHTARFVARELTIPPGHPVLDGPQAAGLRDAALAGAHASVARLHDLETLFDELYEQLDVPAFGASRRSMRTRVASIPGTRSAAWQDLDTGFEAAVLKRDDFDLMYHDSGPAIGPQLLAYTPQVGRVAPDLLQLLQPLPTSPVGLESLQRYAWSLADGSVGADAAWIARHPTAPDRALELVLDVHSGLPRAVSMPYDIGAERNAVACWMESRTFEDLDDQPWLGRLLSVQVMGGGLGVTAIEIESVSFAPTAADLALALPASTHLYDHRSGQEVYHGPRSEWPDEISLRVRRGSAAGVPPLAEATSEFAATERAPSPPSDGPRRSWGRFLAALMMVSGVVLVLAPARSQEVTA